MIRLHPCVPILLALATLFACGPPQGDDAGVSPRDAGATAADAGPPGRQDGGRDGGGPTTRDGGLGDADGGSVDAGADADAGPRADAGNTTDAGATADGGTTADSGTGSDSGASIDAGPESLPPFDAGLCSHLKALASAEVSSGLTVGIAFSAQLPDGARCTGAAGLTALDGGLPMTATSLFRIGSVTKTFVAAVILELVDENVLSLNDPVSKWLPTFTVGAVTIEQLLTHTSGLVDYLFDPTLQAQQSQPHTADQLYVIASEQSGATAPGTWHYSNTNFLLLGRIIQAATGQTWGSEVRRRILNRPELRLGSTFIDGFEPVPTPFVRGYQDEGSGWVDQSALTHPTVIDAAGCMVSSMVDLSRWWTALNTGRVFSPQALTAMRTHQVPVVAGQTWGLGVQIQDGTPLGVLYGHGGGLGGYSTQMQYFEGPGMTLTVAENISLSVGDPLERVDPVTMVHRGIRPRLWQALLGF